MNRSQKGFSAVEALLILIIISLVGVVGWHVWSNRHKNQKGATPLTVSNQPSHSTTTSEDQSLTVPSDWVEHKYPDLGITFFSPKNWTVEEMAKAHQVSLESPTSFMKADGKEIFLSVQIASPSANQPDKEQSAKIFSSTPIASTNLLQNTFLTTLSSNSNHVAGVSSFALTQSKYDVSATAYKPAMLIDSKSYEIWGNLFYESDRNPQGDDFPIQPEPQLNSFNALPEYKQAQIVLSSLKSL